MASTPHPDGQMRTVRSTVPDGMLPTDWRELVAELALKGIAETGADRGSRDRVYRLLEEHLDRGPAFFEIEDAVSRLIWDLVQNAALFGAALARTWPERPEDLPQWYGRALAVADLGSYGAEPADSEASR